MELTPFNQAAFDIRKIVNNDKRVFVRLFDGVFYFAYFEARHDDVQNIAYTALTL